MLILECKCRIVQLGVVTNNVSYWRQMFIKLRIIFECVTLTPLMNNDSVILLFCILWCNNWTLTLDDLLLPFTNLSFFSYYFFFAIFCKILTLSILFTKCLGFLILHVWFLYIQPILWSQIILKFYDLRWKAKVNNTKYLSMHWSDIAWFHSFIFHSCLHTEVKDFI